MKLLSDTLMGRALGVLAGLVCRHRRWFFYPQLLLFGLSVIYTSEHFVFDPNQNDLVGSDKQNHRNFLRFKEEFPTQDDLVVVVQSENVEKNRQFVERLGRKLDVETNLFTHVMYRNDFKMLGSKALLMVPEKDLADLRQTLADYFPFIDKFTHATNLVSLFAMVNSQILHAKNEENAENKSLVKAVPSLENIVKQALASLQRPGVPPSPGVGSLFDAGEDAQYITFAHGQIYLVTAQARREEMTDSAVEQLRTLVRLTQLEVPGVNVGITGEPVLDNDQMTQSEKDTTLASVISLVVCAFIFIYGYQETGRPLKATFCLIVGLGYTLAFSMLVVGHLNILTITFLPILIGLAIDFGVHLITRYEEELRLGKSEEEAMRKAMVFTGQGIITGALTTAAAFLAMGLTNFKGIQEMGVICGGGMLICLVPMLTLLPVMLMRGRQNELDRTVHKDELRERIENIWLKRPVTVTIITVLLTAISLTQFHKVHFDYNLLDLQSRGLPSVVFAQKLIDSKPEKSLIFGVVIADTPKQALDLEKKLRGLSTVTNIDSMAPYLTEDPAPKLKLIHQIKQQIAPLRFEPVDDLPVKLEQLSSMLWYSYGDFGQVAENVPADETGLRQQLASLRETINDLRKQMLGMDPALAARQLTAFQQALFNDVHDTFETLREQDDTSGMRAQDLPPALRDRFIGVTGKYLLQVYPRGDVWQRDVQEAFVKQIQNVDPGATGTPVQLYYYTELLKESYQQAAWYALIAIAIMIFLHFRTVTSVLLALLPVAIGSIWMAGLMGALHIPFNPANIMTLPLVIGIGVTNGIHILNRFAEERTPSILSKSTGKAVFVSGLTAISGFGSLLVAKHQGIRSLGELMSVGVTTCMVAALTFLPAILNLVLGWQRGKTKQPSGDNARSTLGREEPR
jgi:hopanoid biosynthesis associated RND transporter like protein HpnN